MGVDFAMLFTLRESRRTPDPALLRIRSKELRLTLRGLDSEALRLLQRWGKATRFNRAGTNAFRPFCIALVGLIHFSNPPLPNCDDILIDDRDL